MNKRTMSIVGLAILAASAISMDAAAMGWFKPPTKPVTPVTPAGNGPEIDVASGTGAITLVAGAMFLVREKRRRKNH